MGESELVLRLKASTTKLDPMPMNKKFTKEFLVNRFTSLMSLRKKEYVNPNKGANRTVLTKLTPRGNRSDLLIYLQPM